MSYYITELAYVTDLVNLYLENVLFKIMKSEHIW